MINRLKRLVVRRRCFTPSTGLLTDWARSDWPDYHQWILDRSCRTADEWAYQRLTSSSKGESLVIAIVTPVYNTHPVQLYEALLSVRAQSYPHWRLYLIDDQTSRAETIDLIEGIRRTDPRIRVLRSRRRLGISAALNFGVRAVRESYIAFLDHDDRLAPDALWEIARSLSEQGHCDWIYTDRDNLALNGYRVMHQLKPDWSPETLLSGNYLFHLNCIRTNFLRRIGGFRPVYDGSQDFDLILRAAEETSNIRHIPRVLYHWRQHPGSISLDHQSKAYVYDAGLRALRDAICRRDLPFRADSVPNLWPGHFRLRATFSPDFDLERMQSPSHGSNYQRTAYRSLTAPGSADVLVVLGEDVVDVRGDSAAHLASFLLLPGVAAATGKVLTDTGELVHAGLVQLRSGLPSLPYLRYPADIAGYMGYGQLMRNVSAVWPWCFAIRRSTLAKLGGLDASYSGPHAILDLCMRIRSTLRERIVYIPEAVFVVEAALAPIAEPPSFTSCPPDFLIDEAEVKRFKARWSPELENGDPYVNPGLDQGSIDLSLAR